MNYLMAYESKPEAGYQVRRGSRTYSTAKQAIKAAEKMAATNCNASAMQTQNGNLVRVLWSTNEALITPACPHLNVDEYQGKCDDCLATLTAQPKGE